MATLTLVLAACGNDDDSGSGSNNDASGSDVDTSSFTKEECPDGATSADTFKVGGILPITGNLAFLGPPEIAGLGLAVSDINEAGGVDGVKACQEVVDSGGTNDMNPSSRAADAMVAGKASVVIGAAASSISENIIDTITDAKIVQISPANTSNALTGRSPFYFRTAPPDVLQGDVLGNLIASDGHQRIAFMVFDDPYGTGLRDVVQETVEAAGGEVVYGGKGSGQVFQPGQTEFTSEVTAAVNSKPDVIVILTFDEVLSIVPQLASAGWDMSKTYYSDGSLKDMSQDVESGLLEGARGTTPGAGADKESLDRISAWYEEFEDEELRDFTYANEAYDAVILAALAAVKGGDTTPATIQKNLAAVSGANGGEECESYADCVKLLEDGQEIHYRGPSGVGPFNDKNDPSSAFVGIYTYDDNNTPQLEQTQEGKS